MRPVVPVFEREKWAWVDLMGSDPLLTVVEVKNVWVLASIAVMKGSDPIKSTLCWRPMVDSCRPTSPKSGRQISAKSAYSFRLRAKPGPRQISICLKVHAMRVVCQKENGRVRKKIHPDVARSSGANPAVICRILE